MRISDWSSDVCSSDRDHPPDHEVRALEENRRHRPFRLIDRGAAIRAALLGEAQLPTGRRLLPVMAHLPGEEVHLGAPEIGRASCRERVCPYVYISLFAFQLQKTASPK